MIAAAAKSGFHKEPRPFVAIQPERRRLVVLLRTAHVHRRVGGHGLAGVAARNPAIPGGTAIRRDERHGGVRRRAWLLVVTMAPCPPRKFVRAVVVEEV